MREDVQQVDKPVLDRGVTEIAKSDTGSVASSTRGEVGATTTDPSYLAATDDVPSSLRPGSQNTYTQSDLKEEVISGPLPAQEEGKPSKLQKTQPRGPNLAEAPRGRPHDSDDNTAHQISESQVAITIVDRSPPLPDRPPSKQPSKVKTSMWSALLGKDTPYHVDLVKNDPGKAAKEFKEGLSLIRTDVLRKAIDLKNRGRPELLGHLNDLGQGEKKPFNPWLCRDVVRRLVLEYNNSCEVGLGKFASWNRLPLLIESPKAYSALNQQMTEYKQVAERRFQRSTTDWTNAYNLLEKEKNAACARAREWEQACHIAEDKYREERESRQQVEEALQRSFEGVKAELERKHAQLVKDIQIQAQQIQGELHQKVEIEKTRRKTELKTTKEAYETEIRRMNEHHKEALSHQEQEYSQKERRYLESIEIVNNALMKREQIIALTDSDLKKDFMSLAADIDQLARRDWQPGPRFWTEENISDLRGNVKRLKQRLLQDSIWRILFEGIFCNPFRVFGKQGQEYAQQWHIEAGTIRSFANHSEESIDDRPAWPYPTLTTEKWRADQMETCQKILEEPAQEGTLKASVKKGFGQTSSRLRKEIVRIFNARYEDGEGVEDTVADIVSKAAAMWIKFCTHRYRLTIELPGNSVKSVADNIKRAERGALVLTILPKLLRNGNFQGQNLDSVHIVVEEEQDEVTG